MTRIPITVSKEDATPAEEGQASAEPQATEAAHGAHANPDAAGTGATDTGAAQAEAMQTRAAPPQTAAPAPVGGETDDHGAAIRTGEGEPASGTTTGDGPATDATVAAVATLEAELGSMRVQRDRAREQLLRSTADFDNFRKRVRREVEEAKMRGKDDAVRELLPVFDNLERAVQASEGASEVASVVEGVQMVLKLFSDTAGRMGLQRAPGVGGRFDPAVHEAIQQLETDAHPAGTIVQEVAAGYLFGQRLLRPGMVVVAKAPAETPDTLADTEAETRTDTEAPSQPPADAAVEGDLVNHRPEGDHATGPVDDASSDDGAGARGTVDVGED